MRERVPDSDFQIPNSTCPPWWNFNLQSHFNEGGHDVALPPDPIAVRGRGGRTTRAHSDARPIATPDGHRRPAECAPAGRSTPVTNGREVVFTKSDADWK